MHRHAKTIIIKAVVYFYFEEQMARRADFIREAAGKLVKHATAQLSNDENIKICGYATLTGWKGPKRCFICITNERILILWLKKKYEEVESEQDVQYKEFISFNYVYSKIALFWNLYPYNQKPYTPRLNIELINKERLSLAFDNQDIAKSILEELEKRLPLFRSE